MQKIFITIPWFTPAFKAGGPVQSIYNMVAELNEGYEFFIFCSNTDLHGLPLHITQTDTWTSFNNYTQVWYAGKADRSENLVKQVGKIKPSSIFIIGLFDWHFNLVPLFFCRGVRKILSARGMLHPGALSQKPWKKKIFLQVLKGLQLHKRTCFHATDSVEETYIKSHFGNESSVYQAGNFARRISPSPGTIKIKAQLLLISIGIVSPMKNTLLVLEALQNCKEKIQYDIFGPVKEMHYWEKCLQQIKLLPPNITVRYHKEISPADVPGKLNAAEVFVMPSKSENFGHAIIEALYAALPVITSNFTPWEQLEAKQAGFNVPLDPCEIGRAISCFAEMNDEAFREWRKGATNYAEQAMDGEKLKNEYASMFFASA